MIKFLGGSGAKINGRDNYGMTPLHYAAMRGNEVAARDLLTFEDIKVEVTILMIILISIRILTLTISAFIFKSIL